MSTPNNSNASLFLSGEHSDLEIECRGWTFKAHKSVLCPQSDFFMVACNGGFKESTESIIRFPEEKPATVWRVLQSLYTGKYDVRNTSTIASEDANKPPPNDDVKSELVNHFLVYKMANTYGLERLSLNAASRYLQFQYSPGTPPELVDALEGIEDFEEEFADTIERVVDELIRPNSKEYFYGASDERLWEIMNGNPSLKDRVLRNALMKLARGYF